MVVDVQLNSNGAVCVNEKANRAVVLSLRVLVRLSRREEEAQ